MTRATDQDRFPSLGDDGRRMLAWLREHPHAPIFRDASGHRLADDDLAAVRAHEAEVLVACADATLSEPAWIAEHLRRVHANVPFHRARGVAPGRLVDAPTTSRADFAHDIAVHVPDDVDVDRLITFRTTGTTGHPLVVASHPRVAASYLAFHKRAVARFDITLTHGRGQVGVVLLGHQQRCFTYVSVTPMMGESGLAKLNLHPNDWRDPDDRARYLDALDAEVLSGDPLSLSALLTLDVHCRPRAILSTSMTLTSTLAAALGARFGCPVIDIYSMNEAGPIGVFDARRGGHVLLQPRLHVEILDADDQPVPHGRRGAITLTGGFNFCLPLVRYRTGDHAALVVCDGEPVLVDFDGRRPVRYRTRSGAWLNNIDVTHALAPFDLRRTRVHQASDGAITASVRGHGARHGAIQAALVALFGQGSAVSIVGASPDDDDDAPQYTSALAGAEP